jgi:hypothetical protein
MQASSITTDTHGDAVMKTLFALVILAFLISISSVSFGDGAPAWRRAPENTFQLTELVLARRVADRKPLETGQTFTADGGRIYAFLNLFNKGEQRQLKVVWRRGEKVFHQAALRVGRGPSWRTWAFVDARASLKGSWRVTVLDEGGRELAGRAFTLQ